MLFAVALALPVTAANAQTWSDLQALPRETPVRVFEAAGKGWTFADGKLLLVKDNDLTLLRNRRPITIARTEISKIETRRRDSPVEGAIIGALVNVLTGALGGWQGCSQRSGCVVAGIASGAGLGALVDWQIVSRRTVYRAP